MTEDFIMQLKQLFPIEQDEPITLRALAPKGKTLPAMNETFFATQYPCVEDRMNAMFRRAIYFNDREYNVYTTFIPINPDFNGKAVTDADIAWRRRLLIDLDRADPSNHPATDDEIKEAFQVADRVADWFRQYYDDDPIRVMSGNGAHLYYPIDLPNDEASAALCKILLKTLARQFNTSTIKVDTTVSNASRITKMPGTIARRGLASEDRPYRTAVFL